VDLLDQYAIYQILMDYWADVMQDDVYIITQEEWKAASGLRELVVEKGKKLNETPDLIVNKVKYKAEIISPALITTRFFSKEQSDIDELQVTLDSATQELESYVEEHSAEEGLFSDAQTDAGKVTKKTVANRLKEAIDTDEIKALKQVRKLIEAEAANKKAVKETQEALDKKVLAQYSKLSHDDIQTLVVEDKWHATLHANIQAEIERVTQQLANRVKELEERYDEPLPEIVKEVNTLSEKVDQHLKDMGLSW